MSIPSFCVSWNSYINNICNGFSRLRQHEEFVDMTLAAEGHLVKVHRNLIALASPYIKEMLKSAACQHPVIFLNNISYKVLSYILEYIYNGEVQVPSDMLSGFLEASMALQIQGVEQFVPPKTPTISVDEHPEGTNNFAAHITINSENFDLEVQQFDHNRDHDYSAVQKEQLTKETLKYPTIQISSGTILEPQYINHPETVPNDDFEENPQNLMDTSEEIPELPNLVQNTIKHQTVQPQDVNNIVGETSSAIGLTGDTISGNVIAITKVKKIIDVLNCTFGLSPQYTISNRGSLQLILNRHLYYFHHQSCEGRKRRWRCIDYRRVHCPAYIDTDGEAIMKREGVHCHDYHDSKIDKKRRKSLVYRTIASVEIGAKYYNTNNVSGDEEDKIKIKRTESKSLGTIN